MLTFSFQLVVVKPKAKPIRIRSKYTRQRVGETENYAREPSVLLSFQQL